MFLQINKNSENIRVLKIANTIKSILSDAFLKGKIKDKDLFDLKITITNVEVTKDLSIAKIYIYLYSSTEEKSQHILKVLNKKSFLLKNIIAKNMHIRSIPNLIFVLDNLYDRLEEANKLFNSINIPKDEPK